MFCNLKQHFSPTLTSRLCALLNSLWQTARLQKSFSDDGQYWMTMTCGLNIPTCTLTYTIRGSRMLSVKVCIV